MNKLYYHTMGQNTMDDFISYNVFTLKFMLFALVFFLQARSVVFSPHTSLIFPFLLAANECLLYFQVLKNNNDGSEIGSLLQIMNHTLTIFGSRLLRQWV